jgi:Rrf2 family nitric oxide-sensitive transcriptional repressor
MFSQTAEYALRVMVHLATQDNKPATTRQIAAATQVPEGYLSKVLQSLGRSGFVVSQRGLHGGFVLGRPVDEITVYSVIESVDPIKRLTTCPLGIKSHGTDLCALHRRLDDAMGLVEAALRKSTLADLIADASSRKPLCEQPAVAAFTRRNPASGRAQERPRMGKTLGRVARRYGPL